MYQTFYQNQNFMKNKNTWGMNNLGKPHVRILGVQLEFCRKGWWVETPCQMGCGNSSLNMTITEAFDLHHISPLYTMISIRIPSKNHFWPKLLSAYPFPKSKTLFLRICSFSAKNTCHTASVCSRGGGLKCYSAECRLNMQYPYVGLP